MTGSENRWNPRWTLALLALSFAALAVRELAARTVGFGDSEALYASYALFPAPAYLDHPGFIAVVARVLAGHGVVPTPEAAHGVTALLATLAPLWFFAACRLHGCARGPSLGASLAVAVAPEIAVGLFAMTPDLLLFFTWTGSMALFARALRWPPGSSRAAAAFAASGLLLGVACVSKVSALTLAAAFLVVLATPRARSHAKTLWPWLSLALAVFLVQFVVLYEARAGWPMLRHRLVETQHDAGLTARNLAAVVIGQAAYVSPVLCVVGVATARDLFRARRDDVVLHLLAAATFVPLLVLGALCLWSKVAEPHWLAPAWLGVPIYYAYRATSAKPCIGPTARRLVLPGIVVGLAASSAVYAWVLIPPLVRLVPRDRYDSRLDIANELYGWPAAATDVLDVLIEQRALGRGDKVAVVGPVWMISAQLRAALPPSVLVGCRGRDCADFATWAPERRWADDDVIVFVRDNRYPRSGAELFSDRAVVETHVRTVMREGRVARTFTIEVLAKAGEG